MSHSLTAIDSELAAVLPVLVAHVLPQFLSVEFSGVSGVSGVTGVSGSRQPAVRQGLFAA